MKQHIISATIFVLGAALAACSSDESAGFLGAPPTQSGGGPRASGVAQPGAQDFGLFRQILDRGEIPSPAAIDELGFFAEHKLDYPEPDCGRDICGHGLLGVMGNLISGSNCTMVQIGMNSPIDAAELERPPLNLTLAIDTSGSMRGEPIRFVQSGLMAMLDHLQPEDRISVVQYSTVARLEVETASVSQRTELEAIFGDLRATGSTNIYGGLFEAFEVANRNFDPERQNRVLFLSDGVATVGVLDPRQILALARENAKRGIGLTTVGVGSDFDVELMQQLGEIGAGNFYFLENPQAVQEVFAEEVQSFLHPIALDAKITIDVGDGYTLRRAYGTNGFEGHAGGGEITIPALFIAGRTSAQDPIEGGRRGGGGAIMLELLPRADADPSARSVVTLKLETTDPKTGERGLQRIEVENGHGPGFLVEGGYFTDETVQKGFVMLNILAGFQMAAALAGDADVGAARGVLQSLGDGVRGWLVDHPDPDIEADLVYIEKFDANLAEVPLQTPLSRPPEPWPQD